MRRIVITGILLLLSTRSEAQTRTDLAREYTVHALPLLKQFCFECHSGERVEAEIDLSAFRTLDDVEKDAKTWVRIREMLDTEQMPPADSPQPADAERERLRKWVRRYLVLEARARAGDPGPVVLRRLSNAEYTYSIRDLTGVSSLDPAREFPIDGAAGEGFTNVGSALVMSPALLQKYLDAARSIADHAVLYPNGVRFSQYTTKRDLTDAKLRELQSFYSKYSNTGGGITVNLTGRPFTTNQGGVLPIAEYLTATIEERDAIRDGKTVQQVADERNLSPKYLRILWTSLTGGTSPLLLDPIRESWKKATPQDVPKLVAKVEAWGNRLWKFNVVGHVGREGGPSAWMEPLVPIAERRDFRLKLEPETETDVVVRLLADDVGDGHANDYVLWRDARLVGGGKPDVPLHSVASLAERLGERRAELMANLPAYLAAAGDSTPNTDIADRAKKHGVQVDVLRNWLRYLNLESGGPVNVTGHYTERLSSAASYDFVTGWGNHATPQILANSSDQDVNIPGRLPARSLAMHPSPTLFAAVGWQSPMDGIVEVQATIRDAHPACGNGAEWFVQHRRSDHDVTLGTDVFDTNGSGKLPPTEITVRKREVVSLLVGPRDGSHVCDLTNIDLTVTEATGAKRVWSATKDLTSNISHANPHADAHGNNAVWHFYSGPVAEVKTPVAPTARVPAGSMLALWMEEKDKATRKALATRIAAFAKSPAPKDTSTPDRLLWQQIHKLPFALDDAILRDLKADLRFGTHPLGHAIAPGHVVTKAPSTLQFRIPAELATGREFVIIGTYDATHGQEGATLLHASTRPGEGIPTDSDIVCRTGSDSRKRIEQQLDEFRNLFPPALSYTRIVPVDEVVTATLFHREDGLLKRLILDDNEAAELDQLWDELLWVSEEPLKLVVSLEQIREFSTQDRPDMVGPWDKMKPAVRSRAEAFEKRVLDAEPNQLQSVLAFADRAWRRTLTDGERGSLNSLYRTLRKAELSHEQSLRLLITRILTSPSFLYRRESPVSGDTSGPVTSTELATRLSYFLRTSTPDEALLEAARNGSLSKDEQLLKHARRLLQHPHARRLAIHFACQWLHIRDFNNAVEKNEKLYPQFTGLRDAMNEEAIRFFEDIIRNDRSILDIFDSDHTFVNEQLAGHYGLNNVSGEQWRRVEGLKEAGRGGVLAMASVLASQSGASRTSPILRGTWVSETLLGERLPKPPANVPVLPESVPSGLTARVLITRHSSAPECAKCHKRIDPYGFALEQFDTIGRRRPVKADTSSTLPDGQTIDGLSGLRRYLLTTRRDDVVRQFCRKLLGYALGREVQLSDEQLLEEMQTNLKKNGYRFSAAVDTIVLSKQFRYIRARSQQGMP